MVKRSELEPDADRVAVVFDRHPLWLEAMASLVEAAGLRVVGMAREVDELLALLGERLPAVLVLGADGSESDCDVIRRARTVCPDVEAVVVADVVDAAAMRAAFAAGAAVYCLTTAERADLAAALRESFRRSIYFAASETAPVHEPTGGGSPLELTPRELDILRLVARGWSNPRIAKARWVTQQTVKFHLTNIYRKLNVSNRTEASHWAYVHGVYDEDADEATGVAPGPSAHSGSTAVGPATGRSAD